MTTRTQARTEHPARVMARPPSRPSAYLPQIDRANGIARANCPEIIFCLASAVRDSERLPPFLVKLRLEEAREATERLLVAILAAEQSIAPQATPASANDHPTYDALVDAIASEMGASA